MKVQSQCFVSYKFALKLFFVGIFMSCLTWDSKVIVNYQNISELSPAQKLIFAKLVPDIDDIKNKFQI
ncbi:hypothetical protein [Nostoc sp. FACHB-110]|uniref:hypothetical protein n=1 Tax=Nostoc sp. FACHB-110 TaxID=2692834 RepID=UPI001682CB03|nr:hypothetical protein [Nostoc sp. FACHB-110]MBD2438051.1 hypothetical protein [Nostoc sp. FACHB-110]